MQRWERTKILRKSENDAVAEISGSICEEHRDHCWVDDVDGVIEHGDDEAHDERCSELAALVAGKDMGWSKWLLERGKCFP